MLELEQWLLLGSILSLATQALNLKALKPRYYVGLFLLPILAWWVAPTLSQYSVASVHILMPELAVTVGVIWVLEAMLAWRYGAHLHSVWVCLSPVSILGFLYLLMRFFQAAWLPISFTSQALVLTSAIAIIFFLVWNIYTQVKAVNGILVMLIAMVCGAQILITTLYFSQWPQQSSQVDIGNGAGIATFIIGVSILLVGMFIGFVQIRFYRDKL